MTKNRHTLRFALIVAVLVAGSFSGRAEVDGTSSSRILAFGDHLFERGDYYRAITEFERFLFLHPDSDQIPDVEYRIALCYLRGNKPDAARQRLREIAEMYSDSEVGKRAALMLAGSYHAEGSYERAAVELERYLVEHSQSDNVDNVRLLAGVCYLRNGKPEEAARVWSSVPAGAAMSAPASKLLLALDEYSNLPRKLPLTAGILSGVLPGAGQLYTGHPSDALISFALNGVLIWAAYESFDNDQNVAGAIIVAVELGWYLGNIYNAVNNAHKFNRQQTDSFFSNMEIRYAPYISTERGLEGGMAGVSFRF